MAAGGQERVASCIALPQQDSDQLRQTVVLSGMLHFSNRMIISILLHFIITNGSHGPCSSFGHIFEEILGISRRDTDFNVDVCLIPKSEIETD